MKMKRIICYMIFVMVCAILLGGCIAEPLPETKGEEIGVYVLNDIFVDANGAEILDNGAPVYSFDKDGNIVSAVDGIVVASENVAYFSCISDVLVNEADTKKTIPVYVLSDGSEMYSTVTWSMPIMVGPENVVNSSFTVEAENAATVFFSNGKCKIEFDGTEATTLEIHGVRPGDEELIISNCLGQIVKTVDVTLVAEASTDEEKIAKIEAIVASCVHEYVQYATNISEGYTLYTCKNCGREYRADYIADTIEITPHTHAFTEQEVKATCTEHGYTILTCSECGYTDETNYTKPAHTFADEIIPSTCREKGYTLRTCTACKYTEKANYTELKDHTYKHETVASTCSAEGFTLHTCTICNARYKDNYTETKAHTYVVSTVAASYSRGGYTLHICKDCGDGYRDGYTNKLSHANHGYAVTVPDVESLYFDVDVIYPDEPDYEIYAWNYNLELGNWTFDDVTLTKDGEVVKDIMSYSALMSNPRVLYIPCEEIVQAGMHKAISGPNIIINGYKVPDGDFYVEEYYGKPAFVSYQISVAALKGAGLDQVEKGSKVPGAEEYLGYSTKSPYYVNMSELELDVTFTLLGYDEETNTYSFTAVNNGPFGGTSDIFHAFLDGDRVKTFPNAETEDGYLVDGAPEFQYVNHDDFNTYWRAYGYNRNVLRELVNKEYGTNYAPLDYKYDVEVKGDEYWSVIDPVGYSLRERDLAKMEEFYMSHPEALEEWREKHPNWEEIDYEWDEAPVFPPKIRNAEETE